MANLSRLLPNPGLLGKEFYAGPAFKSYFFVLDSVLLLLAILMNVLILARYWTTLSSFAHFWLVINGLAMISFWFLALRFREKMRELHARRDAANSGPELMPEALRIAASVMHLGLFYGFALLIGLLNLLADVLHKQIYRPG